MNQIATNLQKTRTKIRAACTRSALPEVSVTLVAVSKTHPQIAVIDAIMAGQRVFGENKVQEAEAKYLELKKLYPDLELHLIGPLQTNKTKEAVRLFDVIETLDRPKLAYALAKECNRQGRSPRFYIEVNTGAEPQKAGIAPAELPAFYKLCVKELGLPVEGLMCIPPAAQDPTPHFDLLRGLAKGLGLKKLSMGMSSDYETAIQHGATHVRVGTAIFGTREPPSLS